MSLKVNWAWVGTASCREDLRRKISVPPYTYEIRRPRVRFAPL